MGWQGTKGTERTYKLNIFMTKNSNEKKSQKLKDLEELIATLEFKKNSMAFEAVEEHRLRYGHLPSVGCCDEKMTKNSDTHTDWETRLQIWIEKQHGTAGWEMKLANFIRKELADARKIEWSKHIQFLKKHKEQAEKSGDLLYFHEMNEAHGIALNLFERIYGTEAVENLQKSV